MKRVRILLAAAAGLALVGGGTAVAAVTAPSPMDSAGAVHGCWTTQALHGTHVFLLQDAGTTCPKGTTPISWNQTGPAGPSGPAGVAGPVGSAGASGPAGAVGPTGDTGPVGAVGPVGPVGPAGPTGAAGAAGEAGSPGAPGDKGEPGASAYEIWRDAGHSGTEADFLASLKGATGDTGPQGPAGGSAAAGELKTARATSAAYPAHYESVCSSHNAFGQCIYTDVWVEQRYASTITAVVTCPAGELAQSGGGSADEPDQRTRVMIESRFSTASGSLPATAAEATSWTVTYDDRNATYASSPWSVTAQVRCAAAS